MNRSSLVIGVTALALALATAGVLVHPPAALRQQLRLPLAGQILPAEDAPTPEVAPTDPDDGEGTLAVLVEEVGGDSDDSEATEPAEKANRREGSDDRVGHKHSHDSEDAERSESSRDEDDSDAEVSASSTGSDDSGEAETGSSD